MQPIEQFTKLHELYERKKNQTLDKITKEELHQISKYQKVLKILNEK